MSLPLTVIGASAGGFDALLKLLPEIPSSSTRAWIVVLHIAATSKLGLGDSFARRCRANVKEAEDKEILQVGTVYFAPPDYHVLVETDGTLSLSVDEPVNCSRPSIDVLFESAALAGGLLVDGVILTGANADGAWGLKQIVDRGGRAFIQDPESSEFPQMPVAARLAVPSATVLNLQRLAEIFRAESDRDRPEGASKTK